MQLEAENRVVLVDPSADAVREYLLALEPEGDSSFAYLTRDDGSYVQVAGGGATCVLEWRNVAERRHNRAGRIDAPDAASEMAVVPYSGGTIRVRANERVDIRVVVDVFLAFLYDRPLPHVCGWRDVAAELGLEF